MVTCHGHIVLDWWGMAGDPYEYRTMPAGEFKAKCLRLLDEVKETGVSIVITKRGRPVSRLAPIEPETGTIFGLLPEFSGFWDDPSEMVIDPSYMELLGEDTHLDDPSRRGV